MKGLILAGGKATRLRPITKVTNKHLLPIYDRPMIYYPIIAMQQAGIEDVLVTTNPEHAGDFLNLLGSGEEFGLSISYKIQDKPGGIAEAIAMAESFADNESLMVILGDNLFDLSLKESKNNFLKDGIGARVFAKHHPDPREYGVVEIDDSGKVISIEEKPEKPKSNLIQIGVYMYDETVFDKIKNIKPSARGELEVTDLNNLYLEQNNLYCEILEEDVWWIDAGTSPIELFKANIAAASRIKDGKSDPLHSKEGLDEVFKNWK